MSKLSIEYPHALSRDEALRRIKQEVEMARTMAGSQVNNLRTDWDDSTLNFGFEAMGMKVAGTTAVEEGRVLVSADLPFAAMMFKGMIEQRIRQELGRVLG